MHHLSDVESGSYVRHLLWRFSPAVSSYFNCSNFESQVQLIRETYPNFEIQQLRTWNTCYNVESQLQPYMKTAAETLPNSRAMRKPLLLAHTVLVILKMNPVIYFLSDFNRKAIRVHVVFCLWFAEWHFIYRLFESHYVGSTTTAVMQYCNTWQKVTEWGAAAPQVAILTACRERAITRHAIGDATVITCANSTVICGMCLTKCTVIFRKFCIIQPYVCSYFQIRTI